MTALTPEEKRINVLSVYLSLMRSANVDFGRRYVFLNTGPDAKIQKALRGATLSPKITKN